MHGFPPPLERLIEALGRLPGVGSRTAERLAFHLLKAPREEALAFSEAIAEVKERLVFCRECRGFSEAELCSICADGNRARDLLMVVEHPKDLVAFERTGRYQGLYHVLFAHVAPHEGLGPAHLGLDHLRRRVRKSAFKEVILATNPTVEGDGTALALEEALKDAGVTVTRLARGLPSGFNIEFAGTEILSEALEGRQRLPGREPVEERS